MSVPPDCPCEGRVIRYKVLDNGKARYECSECGATEDVNRPGVSL